MTLERRRTALAAMLAMALAPRASVAQRASRAFRLGWLGHSRVQYITDAFVQGLGELGYREGHNLLIDWRYSEGRLERLGALARELVGLRPDVLVAVGTPAAQALTRETRSIPIVMAGGSSPVSAGLAASLARPGGNVTGMSQDVGQAIVLKNLQLLKDALPGITRVTVFLDDRTPNVEALAILEQGAPSIGVTLDPVSIRTADDIDAAFAAIRPDRNKALLVLASPIAIGERKRIVELAAQHGVPAMYWWRDIVAAGGLMSYGIDWADLFRRTANYVDKVLKGTSPAELPIEQPSKFEMVINLKTARSLGLAIPAPVLLRADELIK